MELGKMKGQSYHRPSGWVPTSQGTPKRDSDCMGMRGIVICKEQATPTHWTPDLHRISEKLWLQVGET